MMADVGVLEETHFKSPIIHVWKKFDQDQSNPSKNSRLAVFASLIKFKHFAVIAPSVT